MIRDSWRMEGGSEGNDRQMTARQIYNHEARARRQKLAKDIIGIPGENVGALLSGSSHGPAEDVRMGVEEGVSAAGGPGWLQNTIPDLLQVSFYLYMLTGYPE
ncbi:hypothetical protein RvY_04426-2 [Ramazzottius varieornatus]|uniref:Uncharacterized protein n=1 Tax=Ramazzottius varieornatus TaxID=947166 RepID=A0A1D1USA2_RAMVA|nr:hypothetical protein RvY_04426-2 [Ramazzottius varieornatus]